MNATTGQAPLIHAVSIGFGLVSALLVLLVLTGRKIPLISSERLALAALVIIGMAACANGIGRVAAGGEWLHPLAILGYLLGGLILIVGAAAFFGIHLPFIGNTRQAILVIGVLGIGKLILSTLHRLIWT
jgi:hypothetical protein